MKDQILLCQNEYWDSYGRCLCSNPATAEYEGKRYCATHHPPSITQRIEAVHAQLDQMWAERAKRCAEFERKRLESIRIVDYVRLHHPEIIESALKEAE
jgi:hypothetical protein